MAIWRIFLDQYPDSAQWAESTLSADETERAARFHFEKDRHCFTLAHACLRDILSRYLHSTASELTFSKNQHQKPILNGHYLHFNLSHSGNHILIAVTHHGKVGVDVEQFRMDLEHEMIAKRFFSPGEYDEYSAVPQGQKMTAFYNCWTRKEAYIKAHGLGLSLPLDSFDVSLTPDEPAILLATRPDPHEATKWTLRSLDVGTGYAGALAVEGRNLEFQLWEWKRIT